MATRTAGTRPEFEPWVRLEATLTRTRSRESQVVNQFVHALDELIAACHGAPNGRS
jgi:hypothetical protein